MRSPIPTPLFSIRHATLFWHVLFCVTAITLQPAELLALSQDAAAQGSVQVVTAIADSSALQQQLQVAWARVRVQTFGFIAKIPLLTVALLIVTVAGVLGSLLSRWGGPSFLRRRNPFLQNLIRRSVQTLVVLLGCVLALDVLGATALVGAVVGTAGLAGLAIGFAFKDIVENYLAGTILALRQPFAKNDEIRVDAFQGKVVRLTPRETILMTGEGNHVRLPNALIFRSPMINFSRNPLRQFQFDAGIGPRDDPALARTVALDTLRQMDGILHDPPPDVLIMDLGPSTVTVRFLAWVDQRETELARARSEAIRLVKRALEDSGITLPAPEHLVRVQEEAAERAERAPIMAPPAAQADVSVDRALEKQIATERHKSDEADLLDKARPNNDALGTTQAAPTTGPQPPVST